MSERLLDLTQIVAGSKLEDQVPFPLGDPLEDSGDLDMDTAESMGGVESLIDSKSTKDWAKPGQDCKNLEARQTDSQIDEKVDGADSTHMGQRYQCDG